MEEQRIRIEEEWRSNEEGKRWREEEWRKEEGRRRVELERGRGLEQGRTMVDEENPYLIEEEGEERALVELNELKDRLEDLNHEITKKVLI